MNNLNNILENIKIHNQKVYNSYKSGEKIDFSLTKKNWGTDVIPKKFWIDPKLTYITKNGCKVENLNIVMKNSSGKEVTFPVKGTLITPRKNKSDKRTYEIWTLDGRKNTNETNCNLDLVLV